MTLSPKVVATLFRAEMKMVLRDRRMLFTSILLPLLVTPLMFLGSSWSLKKHQRSLREMVYRYSVTGSHSAEVRSLISATKERMETAHAVDGAKGRSEPSKFNQTNRQSRFQFEEQTCEDANAALNKGDIQIAMEGLSADEARKQGLLTGAQNPQTNGNSRAQVKPKGNVDEGEPVVSGALVVRIVYRVDREESSTALAWLEEALRETRRAQRAQLLSTHGLKVRPTDVARLAQNDLASKGQAAGLTLGRSLTLLLLFFVMTGGAVVAIDSLAGEKERGTLETLLTTSATRIEILAAKQLVILAVALVITLIQSANLLVYIGFKLLPVPPDLAAAVPPLVVALLFFMFIPVAAFIANLLLLISGYARSYKEAQMYFLPALLIALLPALVPFLPGVTLRSAFVLVPVANIALAVKEVLVGSFDWPMILFSWCVTAGAAVWSTRFGVRFLLTEKLITASDTDAIDFTGGPALFERRVVAWFAVVWAMLILISSYSEKADLRVQITINLVGLFFGASLLMIRRYGLDPRAALALRAPKPAVWIGVLCAVPGGIITALGISQLTSFILPVSTKMEEGFNQAVFTKDIPVAQMLFFLTVMPGFFEEIAFRGLLLHGLRRRLHPVALALVVGIAFGIFHVTLFRLVPTACLGILFAAVTMLTGSIFPAMLWHCLNNATGILVYQLQVPESGLDFTCYATGLGLLAAAFWIFWRNRTPYPGLRTFSSSSSMP